jgi:hypothetical protein
MNNKPIFQFRVAQTRGQLAGSWPTGTNPFVGTYYFRRKKSCYRTKLEGQKISGDKLQQKFLSYCVNSSCNKSLQQLTERAWSYYSCNKFPCANVTRVVGLSLQLVSSYLLTFFNSVHIHSVHIHSVLIEFHRLGSYFSIFYELLMLLLNNSELENGLYLQQTPSAILTTPHNIKLTLIQFL